MCEEKKSTPVPCTLLEQILLVCLVIVLPITSFAECYTVYDKSDKPVYKSFEPPFDLSIPISEGIKSKFPGGYLIQSNERSSCYLRSKESKEVIKKSKEAFENRRIQLKSQGFSVVPTDRTSVLSFPKEVVVRDQRPKTQTSPSIQHEEVIGEHSVSSIKAGIGGDSITLDCPIGSYQWVDSWGNKICKRHFSDEVTVIQGSTSNCPTGTHPWVDNWGNKVCQSFDSQQQYHDTSNGCPIGSYEWPDSWGNRTCKKF